MDIIHVHGKQIPHLQCCKMTELHAEDIPHANTGIEWLTWVAVP